MQQREIRDLIISALVLALVFSIAIIVDRIGVSNVFSSVLLQVFLVSLLVISLSFVLHELSHRYVARFYGCYAEYRMWSKGLLFALIFSFLGIVFAAPGAVMIHPRADLWGRATSLSRKGSGLISAAGPVTNLLLAVIFVLINFIFELTVYPLGNVFLYGAFISTWLALFNLIPIPPLDGSKIFAWNLKIWGAMIAAAVALMFFV
jgi:Zn-dependent protease